MVRLAHSPLNINKKSYSTCVCRDIETEIHLFFFCKFHDAARAILCNRVCNIVTDNKSPELFDFLNNDELWVYSCSVYSSLACLMMRHHTSRWLCFAPRMIFLSIVIDFDNISRTLCIIYGRFVLFCFIFCSCRSAANIWCAGCVDLRFRCCI